MRTDVECHELTSVLRKTDVECRESKLVLRKIDVVVDPKY